MSEQPTGTTRPPLRDPLGILTFLAGLGLLAHETFISSTERPYLIGAALAMMGLLPTGLLDKLRSK